MEGKLSLLAWEYLSLLPDLNRSPHSLFVLDHLPHEDLGQSYYRGDALIKSSVGEFYDENMRFFLETAKSLITPLEDFCTVNDIDGDADWWVNQILYKLLPLGFSEDYYRNLCIKPTYMFQGKSHVLPEVREVMADSSRYSKSYAEQMAQVEAAAHSLSAGFTPQEGVPKVMQVYHDMGAMEDAVLANILYPWVMQPLNQLRMLVSTLPKIIRNNIINGCVGEEGIPLYNALDVGYPFTFDVLADYITYTDFIRIPSYIQRQFWTPWLGFDFPSALVGFDDKYMAKIKECIERSNRLYTEILKTGLKYEAQYAVLAGFRGRFCVAGTLDTMRDVKSLRNFTAPLTKAVAKDILDKIKDKINIPRLFNDKDDDEPNEPEAPDGSGKGLDGEGGGTHEAG